MGKNLTIVIVNLIVAFCIAATAVNTNTPDIAWAFILLVPINVGLAHILD